MPVRIVGRPTQAPSRGLGPQRRAKQSLCHHQALVSSRTDKFQFHTFIHSVHPLTHPVPRTATGAVSNGIKPSLHKLTFLL